MQSITISTRILHIMHNHHMHKCKTSYVNSSIGAICNGACLDLDYLPLNLVLVDLPESPVPPSPPSE
jgi:hypothetical protein